METLEHYLNRKVISRMVRRGDFAALNMTRGDETVFATDTAFADSHMHANSEKKRVKKQTLRYLERAGAEINEKGHVLSGKRGSLSFVIKNYRGI